jgi:hypothetical protein
VHVRCIAEPWIHTSEYLDRDVELTGAEDSGSLHRRTASFPPCDPHGPYVVSDGVDVPGLEEDRGGQQLLAIGSASTASAARRYSLAKFW